MKTQYNPIWFLNGFYYDEIVNAMPMWALASDEAFLDYIYATMGI